jgi:hypothetical protein
MGEPNREKQIGCEKFNKPVLEACKKLGSKFADQ